MLNFMPMVYMIQANETVFDSEIHIENYIVRHRDRNRQGGGVCVSVRNDLTFDPVDDLSHVDLEATWIEILPPKTKRIVFGTVYRPPS